MGINVCLFDGNLTDDAVERATKDGKTFIAFRLAHNDWNGSKKVTNYYSCTSFSKYVIRCAPSLKKGAHVVVRGKHFIREYQTKDGTTGTSNDITVDEIDPPRRGQSEPDEQPSLYESDIPF